MPESPCWSPEGVATRSKQLWRAQFDDLGRASIAATEAAARTFRMARTAGLGIHQIPGKLADLQTAGIAIAHGLQLATHNIGDFQGLGLDLIDPWASNK
jgi:predicted nucleic acid-binding protein